VAIREFNLWAGPLGYAVVRGRTKYRKDKSLQKAWVICDRGKKPQLSVAAADSKRPNRSSKKTGCPFSITLLEAHGKGCGLWAATLIDGDHNHPPSSDPADHCAIRSIYKGDGFKETVEAHKKTGLLGSHTLNVFGHENPTIPLTSRDVYNQRAISRRQELNGKSPIETLFEMAGEDFHRWRHNSGHLSGLFLAYKPNRPLIANNPEVVIIDTYKTNMFKMPLVNFIGITPNNVHFLMGCAFMPSDTVEEHRHALDSLIQLYQSIEKEYPHIDMAAPATILGDGDAQQMAAIETAFPDTLYRLCIWSVNATKLLPRIEAEFNSRSNNSSVEECKQYVDRVWGDFKEEWMGALQASSPATWNSNWKRFRGSYENRFPSEIAYIQASIVDRHERRLVKCWADREYNWGIQGMRRGGGQYGFLKNELGVSRGDIKDVVDKFRVMLRRTNDKILTSLSQESQKSVRRFEPSFFSKVIRKVSVYALDRVLGQYSLLKPPKGEEVVTLRPCSHLFRASWGLPCVHEIKAHLNANKPLEPEDFHPHWLLDRGLDNHHSVPPSRQLENQPGDLGKDLSTEHNPSNNEVVAAAVLGDNSQLKGVRRAPIPRSCKRKATEDISSPTPISKIPRKRAPRKKN
jgi:hypothetical protein